MGTTGKKILILDDDTDIIEVLTPCLENEGYIVSSALSGEDGFNEIDKEDIDLILLDVVMPDMDGYTFFKKLREDSKKKLIPVIVMTGKPGMKEIFQIEGVSEVLDKPFENKELVAKIEKVFQEAGKSCRP